MTTTLLNCEITDGIMPAEKVVCITDAKGFTEEVSVSPGSISGDKLMASEIGRKDGNVLIELPRESASGRWRMWVKESAVEGCQQGSGNDLFELASRGIVGLSSSQLPNR